MRLGVKAALVEGDVVQGDVEIADGRVAAVGIEPAGARGLAAPGFVDVHVNGFAGVDFVAADADGYRRAATAMAATGVTAFLPTFVSSPLSAYGSALSTVGSLPDIGPRVLGVHLEGPFLSSKWAGAHDPAHLVPPNNRLAGALCDMGPVRLVTLAPELPGGLDLVAHLAGRGIAVSLGHSDADAAIAHAAFDRGARGITHVHNAHRRWSPRDPGLGGVALVRPEATVQAIVDGVHIAPETAYGAFLAARERFCLVTDAVEAAGMEPGAYRLGRRTVYAEEGAVRLADGRLAGSILTMDAAVRNLVRAGASVGAAVAAASRAPALLAGRPDLGQLSPEGPADVAVLDDDLRVVRTLVAGVEVFTA